MKWVNQITSVCTKLKKLIYIIKQLRDILPPKDITIFYLALVESQITYGLIGWGGAYDNILSLLQTCQNTIIKVAIKKDRRYTTEKIFKEFTHFVYKKHNILSPLNHGVNTRYALNKYSQFWLKKTGCRMVFDFKGTQIFNSMPTYLVNIPLPLFKKHITQWLIPNVGKSDHLDTTRHTLKEEIEIGNCTMTSRKYQFTQ
ncbi:neuroblastoma-amplified sequence-like [Aphis craccivora]|uniref:Neuroblastoma-amplified sequence-like n=1 Tax=Aphis craccivora TaxID=307492 RepID=A0A6G0Y6W5_APHCR|nr:neuroblastoma-amplified sequence-like [Aphis craccivora]